ncbi:hypothetical protein ACS7SF_17265 [Ralstonia sp. 25C]|uniref:hypothetical protein n=1 Tax=Ralstonia sp. 25C TaxID=3447363 RepID=UPI003F754836
MAGRRWSPLRQSLRRHRLALAVVALPTALALAYYGAVASDVYVSEASYIVRAPQRQSSSGLGALLQMTGVTGLGRATDDVYAVSEFMLSRDALHEVEGEVGIRAAMSKPTIDRLSRFDPFGLDGTFEALHRYYRTHIGVDIDPTSSISTLTVRAFDPHDAQAIAERLLRAAERRVNAINERALADAIGVAQKEETEAQSKAREAALNLASFRNEHSLVDPEREGALQLEQVTQLRQELVATRTQLAQLRAFAPQNPQVPATELRIRSLQAEIERMVSGVSGGAGSLASKNIEYERLSVEREFSQKRLIAAQAALVKAHETAMQQQLYLERVAEPSLPDEATEPRRLRSIVTTLAFGMICWALLALMIAGVKEHRD